MDILNIVESRLIFLPKPGDTQCLLSTYFDNFIKVVGDPCQKITLLLLKSKSVRVIVPESFF